MRKPMNNVARLPNFIIVGAMKAGTTSMHYILNRHDNVFIPAGEIHFFDLDDIQQHPDFFIDGRGKWIFHDYEHHYECYLDWYSRFFRNAIDGQLIGEDSTTYMASSKAAPRIARLLPNVKLLFMLRDPVARAYSQYWHFVNSGRAIYDFEDTLRHAAATIIQRGLYKEQIERFTQYFPKDHLKFVLFEEFIKNVQATVDDVCEFLGLDTAIDTSVLNTHRNRGTAPHSLRLKLWVNRLNRKAAERLYQGYLPTLGLGKQQPSIVDGVLEHFSPTRAINKIASFGPRPKYPPMASGVREFLEQLYAKENRGLEDLIGIDIEKYWPSMRHHS
jgi:hypothetical protein